MAARLAGKPIPLRRCKHIDLMVPAATEIVIEGRFLPNERRPEGPFGEFMGYYMPVGNNAVFEVLGVTCRQGRRLPQHPVRLAGGSADARALGVGEDLRARQRVLPGIVDVTCQPFVLHSVVKIRQQYEGHARQVLLAVMGAEPTWAKMVTVVDEDVDIYNMDDVMWAILTRSRPDKDFITIADTPTFYRDPHKDHWGRMGIDATAPFGRDEFVRKRIPGAEAIELGKYLS